MKRFAILILACSAICSCSGDDSGSPAKKPSAIDILRAGNTTNNTFTYDSKSRISTMTVNNVENTFEYNNQNQVTGISKSDNTGFDFFYVAGKLDHVIATEDPDISWPITYQNDGRFTFRQIMFDVNASGDLSLFNGLALSYSNEDGPFANVRHINHIALFLADPNSYMYATQHTLEEMRVGQWIYPFEHVLSDQGLFQSTTVETVSIGYYW